MTDKPYASPACLAQEFDPTHVDPQQASDVAHWRRAARIRLLADRAALPVVTRQTAAQSIASHLDRLLGQRFASLEGLIISAWWPIKAELDLRFWLATLAAKGATAALPVILTPKAPLAFRAWTPETRMERGFWNIPTPADGPEITPHITLSPLVGWDSAGYRLGYGGGYFDRTLASLIPSPIAIGIGLTAAHLPTIFPQPHDIPMDYILTETGPQPLHP
ncbi:MAG: 5-formyltetrahydrofolate cyclo-ligase [Cypionkella sp.]|uniref:5-formyltetrahydrofolate cyclo-ligase n=1 Tax=Cypionkella sp. TaxID=2811411 RepID=UPI002ABC83F6|nr:5-formyltetrahydrofolate cyclo-ligase [Cypionkella sp.]MDZ4311170.1 5-formyltetrahydrofolate cyclo-ligase [Cypionkella sp.]MDZ4394501.1 5-formyltetrahydrofolate cyclo-ligase [Cypionkella sp.]